MLWNNISTGVLGMGLVRVFKSSPLRKSSGASAQGQGPKPHPPKALAAPAPNGQGRTDSNLTPGSKAISKTANVTAAGKAKLHACFMPIIRARLSIAHSHRRALAAAVPPRPRFVQLHALLQMADAVRLMPGWRIRRCCRGLSPRLELWL